jgi:hypothetical protein
MARQFIDEADAADARMSDLVAAVMRPLAERYKRHPHRSPRPEHVTAAARAWDAGSAVFGRLLLEIDAGQKTVLKIREIRVCSADFADDSGGADRRRGILLTSMRLIAAAGVLDIGAADYAMISQRALGLWHQRVRGADLLQDLAKIVAHAHDIMDARRDFTVAVD